MFIINDDEIDNIVKHLVSMYSLEFDKNQLAGFKKNGKELSITKKGNEYSISGDFYEGLLSTRAKLLKDITPNIKEINDIFITHGKDIQEELKISIEDGTPQKTIIAHINSFTQKVNENIGLIEASQHKKIQEKVDQLKETVQKLEKYPTIENISAIFTFSMPNFVLFKGF